MFYINKSDKHLLNGSALSKTERVVQDIKRKYRSNAIFVAKIFDAFRQFALISTFMYVKKTKTKI